MKPREWWIDKQDWEVFDEDPYLEDHVYHVIEKSAYDRLEAMCEKLAGALEDAHWMLEELKAAQAEECEKALAEYRAMRDETKMPCPRNE